jgi:hypothetical protein
MTTIERIDEDDNDVPECFGESYSEDCDLDCPYAEECREICEDEGVEG